MAGLALGAGVRAETAAGDAARGAQAFRACVACHTVVPDRNLTGPSLAGVWGRKAGTLASFDRYSPALKAAGLVWDEQTLDKWLAAPAKLVPGNRMPFPGIADVGARRDLIAFLKAASSGHAPATAPGPQFQDLKKVGPDRQVEAIRYCRDTYHVTTADGRTMDFWEANLRFKTDSSDTGPPPGKPAILPAGMMGDRASVFFAVPAEISRFIKQQC
jgi:cytochrome c